MRAIIAGCRDYTDYKDFCSKMSKFFNGFEMFDQILSGGAKGADEMGKRWAEYHSIPVKVFPADWLKHGEAAGPIRNAEMVKNADTLIAFWDGRSKGTANIIRLAMHARIEIHIFYIQKDSK